MQTVFSQIGCSEILILKLCHNMYLNSPAGKNKPHNTLRSSFQH